ncbi:dioxygenase [Pseudonocardiaceae bacterium YIM PH 21723]|nr:dioxygenase [Pseudonocardiaceae bacterium YIM PH 21723]
MPLQIRLSRNSLRPVPDSLEARMTHSRRTILKAGATAAALTATGMALVEGAGQAKTLPLTPCTPGATTPSNIEGPYFKPNTPERSDLVTPGITGVYLTVSGTVFTQNCAPVDRALIEAWQCDSKGKYDNVSYTLRGHFYTDANGKFSFKTIVPADYVDQGQFRTPHIHIKVQRPNAQVLTSQLFFPDDTEAYGKNFAQMNSRDGFIDRRCTIALGPKADNHYDGTFDLVTY